MKKVFMKKVFIITMLGVVCTTLLLIGISLSYKNENEFSFIIYESVIDKNDSNKVQRTIYTLDTFNQKEQLYTYKKSKLIFFDYKPALNAMLIRSDSKESSCYELIYIENGTDKVVIPDINDDCKQVRFAKTNDNVIYYVEGKKINKVDIDKNEMSVVYSCNEEEKEIEDFILSNSDNILFILVDKNLIIYDINVQKEYLILDDVDLFAVSPDDNQIAFSSRGKLGIYNIVNEEKRMISNQEIIWQISFSPSSDKLIYSTCEDGWILNDFIINIMNLDNLKKSKVYKAKECIDMRFMVK